MLNPGDILDNMEMPETFIIDMMYYKLKRIGIKALVICNTLIIYMNEKNEKFNSNDFRAYRKLAKPCYVVRANPNEYDKDTEIRQLLFNAIAQIKEMITVLAHHNRYYSEIIKENQTKIKELPDGENDVLYPVYLAAKDEAVECLGKVVEYNDRFFAVNSLYENIKVSKIEIGKWVSIPIVCSQIDSLTNEINNNTDLFCDMENVVKFDFMDMIKTSLGNMLSNIPGTPFENMGE